MDWKTRTNENLPNTKTRYYVYENWKENGRKARIHYSICPYCKEGKGIHNTSSEVNGCWRGPFYKSFDAEKFAQDGGFKVRKCKHCDPV